MKSPKFKKEISLFLSSEEAKVLKKDIAKLGLTASVLATIMAQTINAQAAHDDGHDDSHNDALSHSDGADHSDHSSHSDGAEHLDHADHADGHADGHIDHGDSHSDATGTHNSVPAQYDTVNRKGGHSSSLGHANW